MASGLISSIFPLTVRLSSHHPRLFSILVPTETYHLSNSITVILGYTLIFLGFNLLQQKRRAWQLTMGIALTNLLLLISRLGTEHFPTLGNLSLAQTLPLYALIPSIALPLLLLLSKRHFPVLSAKETPAQALLVVLTTGVAVILYGVLGFFFLDKHDLGVNFQLDQAFRSTIHELMNFSTASPYKTHSMFGRWFLQSLHLYWALCFFGILFACFRPISYQLLTHPKEREQAAQLLEKYGNNALDIFKLSEDKSYYFAKNNDGFIAYAVANGTAIALGDATAGDETRQKLISDFKNFANINGWRIAFLQVTPSYLESYKACGLNEIKVGENALVNLEKFTNETIKKKTFKSTIKKFEKEGYALKRCAPPHAASLLDEVQKISQAWLSLPGRRERGFSLSQFNYSELNQNNLFVLRNKEGEALAFVNQIRSYAPEETTIDMMRHKEDVPNGTMDFLFAQLLQTLKEDGYAYFSLGLSALSGVGDEREDRLEEKAIHQIYEHLNRFFSYKGLRNYKNKFEPSWQESYLIYQGQTPGLIKTALAIAKVTEVNDGKNDGSKTEQSNTNTSTLTPEEAEPTDN
jgi:phosphatidylglycerol lysyltransferase